jgi:hypothetical protein
MAIEPPETEPAAKRRRLPDDARIRVVDHELAAQDEAIAKHLGGIPANRRSRKDATQQQRANEILHDAISARLYRIELLFLAERPGGGRDVSHGAPDITGSRRAGNEWD